jgi:hypothetical protein
MPWIKFVLDLEPGPFASKIAERLCHDLELLSGVTVYLISVQAGCLTVNTRVSSARSADGRDIRQLFDSDLDFIELRKEFHVKRIFFRAFPREEGSAGSSTLNERRDH